MNEDHDSNRSHLFLVRLWAGEMSSQNEWHGRVQHILTGEAHSFRHWTALVEGLLAMLPETDKQDEYNYKGGK